MFIPSGSLNAIEKSFVLSDWLFKTHGLFANRGWTKGNPLSVFNDQPIYLHNYTEYPK